MYSSPVPSLAKTRHLSWSKASPVFLRSCSLRVSHQAPLLAIALSGQAIIQATQKLIITYNSFEGLTFPQRYAYVLTSSTVGRFSSLEGIELHLALYHLESHLETTEVMEDEYWKGPRLPHIIRAFQQHKLEPSLTRVNYFLEDGSDMTKNQRVQELSVIVHNEVMQHHPRRVSRRGRAENDELS